MSIENIIISIVASLFQTLAVTIIVFKQIDKRNFKEKSIFFTLLFLYAIIGFLVIPHELRLILFILIIMLILYFVLNLKNKKIILYAFNVEVLLTISEIAVSLIFVMIGINSKDVVNDSFYNLLANIFISIGAIILINIPLIKNLFNKLLKLFDKNNNLYKYLYVFLLVLYLMLAKNGLEFILKSNYYINILFVGVIVLILTIIIKNEFKSEKLRDENKQMLNYVTKYEKIIADQGKANHEFKNQLMVISGYAQMKSDKLIEYIDSIIEDIKKSHSSYLISQLNKFPDGGIKGLLYYKLSVMDDHKITYDIDVESGIKTRLNVLSTNIYKNITKILGVLLDNAIDASNKCRSKKVIISVTKDKNKVMFSIYNTYKGNIDISKIGTGYTTKGKGHGYGLKLVKDIISENKSLDIKNFIEDKYYVSQLIISIKTKK